VVRKLHRTIPRQYKYVIHIITFCHREVRKRAGIKDKEKFTGEQYILCMIFLHCYHYFRLGGLRKSTEINCKMDVLEMPRLLDCTAEKFLMEFILLWCKVSILTYVRADKQKTSHNHANCRLTVTPSQCGDRKLQIFSCVIVYQWTLTVWHSPHTALYAALHTHTHKHTHTHIHTQIT